MYDNLTAVEHATAFVRTTGSLSKKKKKKKKKKKNSKNKNNNNNNNNNNTHEEQKQKQNEEQKQKQNEEQEEEQKEGCIHLHIRVLPSDEGNDSSENAPCSGRQSHGVGDCLPWQHRHHLTARHERQVRLHPAVSQTSLSVYFHGNLHI